MQTHRRAGRSIMATAGAPITRLRDGRLLTRREDVSFNAPTFRGFLQELAVAGTERDRRVVVISDNAKHHHAVLHKPWRQEQEPGFALDFLPPTHLSLTRSSAS